MAMWIFDEVSKPTLTGGLVVGTAAVAVYYLTSRYLARGRREILPPCPYVRWPLVGNLPQMFTMKKYAYETLDDFAKSERYNKIFMLYIGSKPVVVLGHISVINEALVQNLNDYANRPKLYSGQLLTRGGKDILFGEYGDTWKYHRKLAYSSVKLVVFGSDIPDHRIHIELHRKYKDHGQINIVNRKFAMGRNLEEIVQSSISKIFEHMDLSQNDPFDIKPLLVLFVFNISCGYSFGTSYDLEDDDFKKFVNITSEFIEVLGNGLPGDLHPLLAYLPSSKERKVKALVKQFLDFIAARHKECKQNLNRDDLHSITDALLDLHMTNLENGVDYHGFTEEHIIMTTFDIFGAGIDTMSTVMHSFIGQMITNPLVMQEMKRELDDVLGTSARLPTLADRSRLPYTEACVNETLRLGTLAPLGFPIETTAPTTVAGYHIPKGTMVISNIWAVHRDPEFWKDPETFDPTRFLEDSDDGKYILNHSKPNISYMPFGMGRRMCIGEGLARSALMLVLPALFHRYQFSGCDDMQRIQYQESGFAFLPKPYKVTIKSDA